MRLRQESWLTHIATLRAFLCLAIWTAPLHAGTGQYAAELLKDDFRGLRLGLVSDVVGAHTEYHYLREAAPQGNWAVSAFKSDGSQRAWRLIEEDGTRVMHQSYNNRETFTHPMLIAGDPLWQNYRVTLDFAPASDKAQSGIVFRYRNSRCYYFFGVQGQKAILKMVRDATGFHKPYEVVLAQKACAWTSGKYLTAQMDVNDEPHPGTTEQWSCARSRGQNVSAGQDRPDVRCADALQERGGHDHA